MIHYAKLPRIQLFAAYLYVLLSPRDRLLPRHSDHRLPLSPRLIPIYTFTSRAVLFALSYSLTLPYDCTPTTTHL